jgi:hypothetical protein
MCSWDCGFGDFDSVLVVKICGLWLLNFIWLVASSLAPGGLDAFYSNFVYISLFTISWCSAKVKFLIPNVRTLQKQTKGYLKILLRLWYIFNVYERNLMCTVFSATTRRLWERNSLFLHMLFILVSCADRNKIVILFDARDSNFGLHIDLFNFLIIILQLFPPLSISITHGNHQIRICHLNFNVQSIWKRALKWNSKCFCTASVTKTFTLKD